jgi:membrane protease YdiL (CAAX protease family)
MSSTLDALQSLEVPPLTVAALTLATVALVASEPVLGRRHHRRFLAEVAADPSGGEPVRLRHYRRWVGQGWLWAAAAVALVAALPGVGVASLGLRGADLAGIGSSVWRETAPTSAGDGLETLAGVLTGLLVGTVVLVVLARLVARRTGGRSAPIAGAAAVMPMLPTTSRGRWGWSALALTAGVTEEITFRGLVLLTVAVLLPDADPRVVVVVAAVLFGLAHAYQGRLGMLATGLVGAALAGLYLGTGSLLVPMVLHVLVDLRPLLLTRRADRTDAAAPTPVPA